MKKYGIGFYLLNICVPLIAGGIIYYLFFPEVFFVKALDMLLPGRGIHIVVDTDDGLARILRYYLFDIIWAYSLTVLICRMTIGEVKNGWPVLAGLVIFEVFMESIQLMPCVYGTFDVCDIAAEIIVSILVIKYYYTKGDIS